MFAAFKAGLVPVNTNYRYADDELVYLWDNADAVAVVFHGIVRRADRAHPRPPARRWRRGSGSTTAPARVPTGRSTTRRRRPRRPTGSCAPWGRGDDDILLMYTGGTTGMPKGVMWRQDTLVQAVVSSANPDLAGRRRLRRGPGAARPAGPGRPLLPAPPLMHGTGQFTTFITLSTAGQVVLLADRKLDPVEILDDDRARRVQSLIIVGDAFAKPIADALDAEPGRWDLSSLFMVTSSGVMWSEPVKQRLLAHNPEHVADRRVLVVRGARASARRCRRASGAAQHGQVQPRRDRPGHRRRRPRRRARLGPDRPGGGQGPDAHRLLQGPREVGGHLRAPRRRDATRSPATTPASRPTARSPCSVAVRSCINTGGEKVYPEEVEEVLKEHPTVQDAVVVGVPDDKFGEAITAVVEAAPGRPRSTPTS